MQTRSSWRLLVRVVAVVVLLCGAPAHADKWPSTSNALEFAGYAGIGSTPGGEINAFAGGQFGFCMLCMYLSSEEFTFGDSHSIYYGYPLGGAIAEGVLARYGVSDQIDLGARLLYELYDNHGSKRQGPVGVVEARYGRVTGSFTFYVNGETYLEGAVRYMLDGLFGLKLHVVRTEATELRLSYGGYVSASDAL